MYQVDHGGKCCGVRHIYDFDCIDDYDAFNMKACRKKAIKDLDETIEEAIGSRGLHGLLEIILNENQISQWRGIITKAGFRRVNSFKNSNTGNICYIYHRID